MRQSKGRRPGSSDDRPGIEAGLSSERFEHLAFERFWLQPMDGPEREANTAAALAYCLSRPQWRLSVQTHKYIGVR